MSHWNHRVMRHEERSSISPPAVVWYAIHEVYYDDDGLVTGWSEDPDPARGDDLVTLAQYLERMAEALKHPVLDHATGREIEPAL